MTESGCGVEQLRQEWQRVQREVQRAVAAQAEAERRRLARETRPGHQVVYRGASAAYFEDREGRDAEPVQPERVPATTAAPTVPTPPSASFDPRAPFGRQALRRAIIVSEIVGPPVALRPPKP